MEDMQHNPKYVYSEVNLPNNCSSVAALFPGAVCNVSQGLILEISNWD